MDRESKYSGPFLARRIADAKPSSGSLTCRLQLLTDILTKRRQKINSLAKIGP